MNKRGIVMLELLISIGIVLAALPAVVGFFVSFQRHVLGMMHDLVVLQERAYMETFLMQDLRQSVAISQISSTTLQMRYPDMSVTYSLKAGHLKREQLRSGKKSTLFLNHHWVLSSVKFEQLETRLIRMTLTGKDDVLVEDIYVPNV
ncbi:MAG: hypothetical protein EXS67_05660 [Candidatus Margulisbacteria bacterium]|nr:hypothetical protein [Candidatus Margulisiibacteriota bacterium]